MKLLILKLSSKKLFLRNIEALVLVIFIKQKNI
jgi:hypothetical protein